MTSGTRLLRIGVACLLLLAARVTDAKVQELNDLSFPVDEDWAFLGRFCYTENGPCL